MYVVPYNAVIVLCQGHSMSLITVLRFLQQQSEGRTQCLGVEAQGNELHRNLAVLSPQSWIAVFWWNLGGVIWCFVGLFPATRVWLVS